MNASRADSEPQDFVEWTSLFVAALRNVESSRPDAFLQDLLVPHLLAGSERSLQSQHKVAKAAQAAAAHEVMLGEDHVTTFIAVRSYVVNEQILVALKAAHSNSCAVDDTSTNTSTIQQQVVMLGAGLDTRAWHLPLPPKTAWFELDQENVLRFKSCRLGHAGAALQADTIGSSVFPLKAASYAAVCADVTQADWTQKLKASGWQENLPTVWVAEGLMYYLEPLALTTLLKTVAELSTAKSTLIATVMTQSYIDFRRKLSQTMQQGQLMVTLLPHFKWGLPTDAQDYFCNCCWEIEQEIDMLKKAQDLGVRLQPFTDEPLSVAEHEAALGYMVMVCKKAAPANSCTPA